MSTEVDLSIADALAARAALESQLGQAHEQIAILEAEQTALRFYADHRPGCPLRATRDGACTCGFDRLPANALGARLLAELQAARIANHIMWQALGEIDKHDVGAYTTEEGAGANVEACEWCGDMREIAKHALVLVKAGKK